jgi:hypothetical protein
MTIDKKKPENVEYCDCLGRMVTNYARCRRDIKLRIVMATAAVNKRKAPVSSKLDVNLREKLVKCYIWSVALCGAETWRVRKVEQKLLESSEKYSWRRMENFSCTYRVRNEEVLARVQEEKNILQLKKNEG